MSPVKPALWRVAVIVLLPVALWGYVNRNQYIPQTAGDLDYEVVINRLTGETCIDFGSATVTGELEKLQCH